MKKYSILILMLIVLGCQRTKTATLLDNPKCAIPCWEGITPGVTTKSELDNLLSTSSIVNHSTIKSWIPIRTYEEVVGAEIVTNSGSTAYLFVFLINDRVGLISVEGDLNLTVDNAVENLGDPQYVVISEYMRDIYASFIDPDTGFTFRYSSGGKQTWQKKEIRPSTEIDAFDFFDPALYDLYVEYGLLSWSVRSKQSTLDAMMPWTGYGSIEEKYLSQK